MQMISSQSDRLTRTISGRLVAQQEPESLETILHAWLRRLPSRFHPLLDYQLHNLPARYFQSLDVHGVQSDLCLIERVATEKVIVDVTDFHGRLTLRVLVAKDEPRIFLRVVSILTTARIHIDRAQIFTGRTDGLVVDHFVLRDKTDPAKLSQAVAAIRFSLLNDIFLAPDLLNPIPVGLHSVIESNAAHEHTVLTLYAANQHGFLYRVANVFAQMQLQLLFANLKTINNQQIIDSFHLVDPRGARLNADDEAALQQAILAAFAL